MSQYDPNPAGIGDATSEAPQTSGLALGSLISSLIFCCPITTVLGVILGLAATISIKNNPMKRGTGLALAGIVIGLVATGVQIGVGVYLQPKIVEFMEKMEEGIERIENGPNTAMAAASTGDYDGFRNVFFGDPAEAPDAEVQAFIEAAESRYGAFVSAQSNTPEDYQPPMGATEFDLTYELTFENQVLDLEAVVIAGDESATTFLDAIVLRFGSFRIIDPDNGDLYFPADAANDADAAADDAAAGDGEEASSGEESAEGNGESE